MVKFVDMNGGFWTADKVIKPRLGRYVLTFWRERVQFGPAQFSLAELVEYCRKETGYVSPAPQRTLKLLRKNGKINYRIVNRKAGQYEALPLEVVNDPV